MSNGYCDPSRFVGDIVLRVIPHWELRNHRGAQLYQLMQPFAYISDYGKITVPDGFITDFASVPTLAKWLVDNDDPDVIYGSLPHDFLYKHKGVFVVGAGIPEFRLTRREADIVLYHAMLHAGAPMAKAKIVFQAVRVGGRGTWNES